MNCCYKIFLKINPELVPNAYLKDGDVLLDTTGGLEFVIKPIAMSFITKLSGVGSKSIKLPITPKNDYFLYKFKTLGVFEIDIDDLDVYVVDNGKTLPFNKLKVTNYNSSDGYTCDLYIKRECDNGNEVILSENGEPVSLETLKLPQIDLGEFHFEYENIIESMDNWKYTDGGSPIHFVHIDFGYYPESYDNLVRSDYRWFSTIKQRMYNVKRTRFLVSPLALLREGFKTIGYSFRSPILESNYGRDIWTYILSPTFGNYSNKGVGGLGVLVMRSEIVNHVGGIFTLLIDQYVNGYNNKNRWDGESYTILDEHGVCEYEVKLTAKVVCPIGPTGGDFVLGIFHLDENGDEVSSTIINDEEPVDGIITIELTVYDFIYGHKIEVRSGYDGIGSRPYTTENLSLRITPSDGILNIYDTFKINETLIDELFIDYVRGILQVLNGRLIINDIEKTVTLYHTSDNMLPTGETPESFYKKKTELIDIGSCDKVISFKTQSSKVIGFKKTDDKENYFYRIIGKNDKVEEKRNEFFSPTVMGEFMGGRSSRKDNQSFPIIPIMHEDDIEFLQDSFDISPRILKSYPPLHQNGIKMPSGPKTPFLGNHEILIAFCTQGWDMEIYNGDKVKKSLRFDDTINNIYDLFHSSLDTNIGISIKYLIDNDFYFDFRRKYYLRDTQSQQLTIVDSINGLKTCENVKTNIILKRINEGVCNGCSYPCDCTIKKCLYYGDLGVGVDIGSVINVFTVNGVPQIEAPISINIPLNIITLDNGDLYATDLVDALNNIGVEYFVFNYAYWKYLTISYPKCYTFVIEFRIGNATWRFTEKGTYYLHPINGWGQTFWYNDGDRFPNDCLELDADSGLTCNNYPSMEINYGYMTLDGYGVNVVVAILLGQAYGGIVSNVETDIIEYRHTIDNVWKPVINNQISPCKRGGYIDLKSVIVYFSQTTAPSEAWLRTAKVLSCSSHLVDLVQLSDANGNVQDVTYNYTAYPFRYQHLTLASMNAFGGWFKLTAYWVDESGFNVVSFIKIELTTTTAPFPATFGERLTITRECPQNEYSLEVRRTTTYSDGCPTTIITKDV